MKNGITSVVVGCGVLTAAAYSASGDHIKFKELPEAAQRTITAHKPGGPIKHIEREIHDGQTFYQVEFRRFGKNPVLRVADNGSLVGDSTLATRQPTPAPENRYSREQVGLARWGSMKLSELPEPVQSTIRSQGAEVADIDKETWNGKTVYEIEFKKEGKNPQIYVADDGSIVKDERVGTGLGGIFLGTQMSDLPDAVQNTVKAQIGSDEILDIDRELRTGKTVYEVQFERNGKNTEIHVAEDGSLVEPASTIAKVRESLGLKKLEMSDLPVAVQNTVKSAAPGAEVADIDKETTAGRLVYKVELKQEGKNIHLQIAEDGSVVRDSR